mgnify:CR=1 FL=1
MCDPVVGPAIAIGVLNAGAGMMAAQEQTAYQNAVAQQRYQAAKQQSERNNQIATQQYNNQLRIAEQKDKVKKEDFEAQLKAYEAALQANNDSTTLNTIEANRAAAEARMKNDATNIEASFELEQSIAEMIKSQGQMLSTGNVGQSFLLQTEDPMRMLGRASAMIDEKLYNSEKGYGLELQGVALDYQSAEWASYNNLPGLPQAQRASLLPYEPIKDPGPAAPIKRSASTGMMTAFVGGVSAGVAAGHYLQ